MSLEEHRGLINHQIKSETKSKLIAVPRIPSSERSFSNTFDQQILVSYLYGMILRSTRHRKPMYSVEELLSIVDRLESRSLNAYCLNDCSDDVLEMYPLRDFVCAYAPAPVWDACVAKLETHQKHKWFKSSQRLKKNEWTEPIPEKPKSWLHRVVHKVMAY